MGLVSSFRSLHNRSPLLRFLFQSVFTIAEDELVILLSTLELWPVIKYSGEKAMIEIGRKELHTLYEEVNNLQLWGCIASTCFTDQIRMPSLMKLFCFNTIFQALDSSNRFWVWTKTQLLPFFFFKVNQILQ